MKRGRRTSPRIASPRRSEPIRTCVGCRQRDRRTALTRVAVRDGALAVDHEKRAPGRGAYLHAVDTCVEAFSHRGGFVRSLRCVIAKGEREALVACLPEVQG